MDEWGAVYRLLTDARRRHVLDYLYRRDTVVELDDLTEAIHEREREAGGTGPPDAEAIHVSLQHVHLPTLDNAGLVEWNREEGYVTLATKANELPLFSPTHGGLIEIARPTSDAAEHTGPKQGGSGAVQSETD
jgi:hypothetical protein